MPNTVRLHRVLATKPHKVYRAFIEADALAKWLPPNGFACTVHHLDAKVGQSAVDRRFSLDVAEVVDPVVRQLQVAQTKGGIRLVDPLDRAVEKIGTFGGDDDRRTPRRGSPQRSRIANDMELLLFGEL